MILSPYMYMSCNSYRIRPIGDWKLNYKEGI